MSKLVIQPLVSFFALTKLYFRVIAALIITLTSFSNCQKAQSTPPPPPSTTHATTTHDQQLHHYICYQSDQAIHIDGQLTEEIWSKTPPTAPFQDIEGPEQPTPSLQTYVKMLWDEEHLYFGAYLEEPHIWANMSERDDPLYKENAFEIFLDPDGDTHHYAELEINARNTVWDLMMLRPYREDRLPKVKSDWNIPGLRTAIHRNGTLNEPGDTDRYWTVEIAIPLASLVAIIPPAYRPREGIQWRVNFARVQWSTEVVNNRYQKKKDVNGKNLPAAYWVWSPHREVNMHMPERWGYIQFSETVAGKGSVAFIPSPEEDVKWALRELYYQQSRHYRKHQRYKLHLDSLHLPRVNIDGYTFQPLLYATDKQYQLSAKSVSSEGEWTITYDGKITLSAHGQ